jgi:3-hydroxyacyl-CoA dehydrogenase
MELMSGTQAKAQQYFFFAERKASKIEGLPEGTEPAPDRQGRRDRRRNDGRRHLDELPQRRHPRHIVEQQQDALDRGTGVILKITRRPRPRGRCPPSRSARRWAC